MRSTGLPSKLMLKARPTLRHFSSWVLKTTKDGGRTNFLDNPHQHPAVLMGKKCSLTLRFISCLLLLLLPKRDLL